MLNQLNILLQKLTGFKLEYHGKHAKRKTCVGDGTGNVLLGKAYTCATDPCKDGSYLIGKYS